MVCINHLVLSGCLVHVQWSSEISWVVSALIIIIIIIIIIFSYSEAVSPLQLEKLC